MNISMGSRIRRLPYQRNTQKFNVQQIKMISQYKVCCVWQVCEYKIVQDEVGHPQPEPFPPCAYLNWGPGAAFFRWDTQHTHTDVPDFVMHCSAKLQSPPLFVLFLCSCDEGLSQTGSTLSFVLTLSDCHLTIRNLIHWIEIDHVQF